MRVIRQQKGDGATGFAARLAAEAEKGRRLSEPDLDRIRSIIQDVRERGDAAIYDYEERFGLLARGAPLRLSREDVRRAYGQTTGPQRAALEEARRRLARTEVATSKRVLKTVRVKTGAGNTAATTVTRRFVPVQSAGCYIPGGMARYPSSAIMCIVPAAAAGVTRIVAVSPVSSSSSAASASAQPSAPQSSSPLHDCGIDPLTVVAADMCGATEIYRVGGAHAIAALAYGTESIPRVDKIAGPGGPYVTAAKSLVSADAGIDMLAGPTELAIVADSQASPRLVALDLISQAEHSIDTQCCLVTTSASLAEKVDAALSEMTQRLPGRGEIVRESISKNGFAAVVRSEAAAVAAANALAPEHLEVMTRNPSLTARSITTPGTVLLGEQSPSSASDYLLGSNHILPTNRSGRTRGSLSVLDFVKVLTVVESSNGALRKISGHMRELAEAEGLVNHYEAVLRGSLGGSSGNTE